MKKQLLLLVLMLLPMVASAHDIEVRNAQGITIYYKYINDGNELAVTFRGSSFDSYSNEYYGIVAIPDSVNYNNVTYNVTSIGSYAFSDCSGLISVIIGNSVTSIGNYAFDGCSKLTSVTLGNSVMSIGSYAFRNCTGLNSVTVPNSVTSIGNSSFIGCSKLTSVIIGSGVTSIGSDAFKNTNLKKVIWLTNTPPSGYYNVSGTINYVSNNNYTSLNNTVVYPFLSSYFDIDGIRYVPLSPSERTCDAIDCVHDSTAYNTVIASTVNYKGISMSVKNIQPYLAYNNIYIKNLNIDIDGKISEYAFKYCFEMRTATLGENVNAIDQYAFQECSKLQRIVIPNSVKSIGIYAFQNCSALEYAQIGKGIETISNYTFSGCSSLKEMIIGSNVSNIGQSAFSSCSALPKIAIPGSVSSINRGAFYNCKSLKEVVMEDRTKRSIIQTYSNWNYSTDNSKMLIYVTIGDTLSFNYEVKYGYLTVSRPDDGSATYYGKGSYRMICGYPGYFVISGGTGNSYTPNCSISDIRILKTSSLVFDYNGSVFNSCPLDSVYIGRNISYYKSVREYSGYSPFYCNTTLRSVVITDKEKKISENEFYGCTNLQRVIIGDGVTTISDYAFSGCQSLKYFTFGTKVKDIGKEAFSDCTSVVEITSKAQTPPTCGTQALDDINKWNCKLFVPKGCIAAYQAADQWKDFFFTEEGEGSSGESSGETETKKCEKPTISYTNGKLTYYCETEGAMCQSTITDADIKSYSGNEVQLTATYNISVYATKAGYDNSDVATATLCWIDVEPKTEGINNGIAQVPAKAVLIQAAGGAINVQGCDDGERIGVYSINGSQVGTAVSQNGAATVNTTLQRGSVAIIKVGKKSVKVMMK